VRQARERIEAGTQEEAQAAVRAAGSIMDRAARRRVLHPNTAARSKSRLMRQLNAMQAPSEEAAPAKRRTRTTTKTRAAGTKAKTSARKTAGRSTRSKKS
jgi:small subunit ribosomal protein S20